MKKNTKILLALVLLMAGGIMVVAGSIAGIDFNSNKVNATSLINSSTIDYQIKGEGLIFTIQPSGAIFSRGIKDTIKKGETKIYEIDVPCVKINSTVKINVSSSGKIDLISGNERYKDIRTLAFKNMKNKSVIKIFGKEDGNISILIIYRM